MRHVSDVHINAVMGRMDARLRRRAALSAYRKAMSMRWLLLPERRAIARIVALTVLEQ